LSELVYNFIRKASEEERKSEEEFLVDVLISTRKRGIEDLLQSLSQHHLELAKKIEENDLTQAGEHYWLSLSYLIKLIALKEDMEINDYHSYYAFIEYLSYKLNDSSIIIDFVNAEKLHGEFHPRPQGEGFEIRKKHAISLLEKLKKIYEVYTKGQQ
jgi:hypothetical protein